MPASDYVGAFLGIQHQGLLSAEDALSSYERKEAFDYFVGDIHIARNKLRDEQALAEAYDRTLKPQMAIAEAVGFEGGWRFAGLSTGEAETVDPTAVA